MAEELILDKESLYATADAISEYCARQREIINVYYAQMMALEGTWQDDKTFGSIMEEIKPLRVKVLAVLDEVNSTYPKYFRSKAQQIEERPTIVDSVQKIKVIEEIRVPSSSVPYSNGYRNYTPPFVPYASGVARGVGGNSSGSGATKITNENDSKQPQIHSAEPLPNKSPVSASIPNSAISKTDMQYIDNTFAVQGRTPQIKSALDSTFASVPMDLIEGIHKNSDKIIFKETTGRSFYDPSGGKLANKSVIAINSNSDTLSDDVLSLVGQHVFYWADLCDREDMYESLKIEGNNPKYILDEKYNAYLSKFKEGIFIPTPQSDNEVNKTKYRTAARFFTECFIAYAKQDATTINDLETFFGKSYKIFERIINDRNEGLTVK